MKNTFHFILKPKVFKSLKYLNICPDIFGLVVKRFDKKAKINFKIYDVTTWETNNYNTHIPQYLKK